MPSNVKRDSFERFSPDLCEFILSYLPLISAFKYESVSKQWSQSVFKRVNHLFFCHFLQNKLFSKRQLKDKLPAMDTLLRKCPNITDIHFGYSNEIFERIDDIRGLKPIFFQIMKHCHHLRSVDNSLFKLSEELAQTFYETIGHKFESIVIYNIPMDFKTLTESLTNVRRLELNHHHRNSQTPLNGSDQLDFPIRRLTHLKVSFFRDYEERFLRTIIRSNKWIKYLRISYEPDEEVVTEQLFTELSKLSELKTLILHLSTFGGSESVLKSFQMIGRKCYKLQKLVIDDLSEEHHPNYSLTAQTFLNLIKFFKNLTVLKVSFDLEPTTSQLFCQSLANCHNLRYLKLSYPALKNNFFKDIHKYAPNLSDLWIRSNHTSNETLNYIKLLPHLRSVVTENYSLGQGLPFSPEFRTIDKLFELCPRLKSFTCIHNECWEPYHIQYFNRCYLGGIIEFIESPATLFESFPFVS